MDSNQRQTFWEALCAANRPEDAQKINATIKLPEHLYRYRAPNMNSLSALMDNRCYFSTSNYYDDPFDPLYYRVVVFSGPLQGHVLHCKGCCGSVQTPYRKTVSERLQSQPLAVLLIS